MINDYSLITVKLTKLKCPQGVLQFKCHRWKNKKLLNINVTAFSKERKSRERPHDTRLRTNSRMSPKTRWWNLMQI